MNTKRNSPKNDGERRKVRSLSSNNADLAALHKFIEDTKHQFEILDKKISSSLLAELDEVEKKLNAQKDTGLTIVDYSAYTAQITALKEKAQEPKRNLISRILPQDPVVAAALLTAMGAILVALINGLQKANTPEVPGTPSPIVAISSIPGNIDSVTVAFSNPNTNWAVVHLVILQNDIEIKSLDVKPGRYETLSLPPGTYQVEARAMYPAALTPSPNCFIQWQQNQSYAGNLTVQAGSQVDFEIRQFYFEPHEICFTETATSPPP